MWQELVVAFVSGSFGMLLLIVMKYGTQMIKADSRLSHLERSIERIETGLAKLNFAEFENSLLERLNGRYLKSDIAQAIIMRSDERNDAVLHRLDRLEASHDEVK